MGIHTDAEELMGKAVVDVKAQKRSRLLWAALTSLGTIVSTTSTVTVILNNYLHKAERENEKLRDSIAVMDKKLETLETDMKVGFKDVDAKVYDARARADTALLYAQLTKKGTP